MVVHALREVAHQAGADYLHVACSDAAFRLPAGTPISTFATGWASAVSCGSCRWCPVGWRLWRRNGPGQSVGDLRPIVAVGLDI